MHLSVILCILDYTTYNLKMSSIVDLCIRAFIEDRCMHSKALIVIDAMQVIIIVFIFIISFVSLI